MYIIKTFLLLTVLSMTFNESDRLSTYMCDEPTDKAVSLVNGFIEGESFSEDRSDLGLEEASPEDIQPLADVSGGVLFVIHSTLNIRTFCSQRAMFILMGHTLLSKINI